jgi:hypothetical protein
LAPGCIPLFLTDGFKEYVTALLTHDGYWVQLPRRHASGPMPKSRWMPRPQLLYAQVVKTVRRRRLVRVSHRVVFGTLEAVEPVLAACGWQIQTAFVERLNLDIRQRVAAGGRRVTKPISVFVCRMRACVCLWLHLSRPTAWAPPGSGSRAHRRWQRDSPIMSGASERCCCSTCRRGRSPRRHEAERAGAGATGCREPMRSRMSARPALRVSPEGLPQGLSKKSPGTEEAPSETRGGHQGIPCLHR